MILKDKSHVFITGMRFLLTTILAFFGVLLIGQKLMLFKPTASQFTRFIFIAISTGMVALLIYYKGLQKTEAKISTILELVFPMLAIFIDAVLYKNFLSPTQYIASGFLLYSIYRISKLNYGNRQ